MLAQNVNKMPTDFYKRNIKGGAIAPPLNIF